MLIKGEKIIPKPCHFPSPPGKNIYFTFDQIDRRMRRLILDQGRLSIVSTQVFGFPPGMRHNRNFSEDQREASDSLILPNNVSGSCGHHWVFTYSNTLLCNSHCCGAHQISFDSISWQTILILQQINILFLFPNSSNLPQDFRCFGKKQLQCMNRAEHAQP